MGLWREYREFFGEFRRSFHTTGSVLPSSRFLARALARPLEGARPAACVLEVGPGTGAVTCEIARRLRPDDRLDCVEINEHFARLVRERIDSDEVFAPHAGRVRVIHAPVEEVAGESAYDFIISGLPLNNFAAGQVEAIFATFRRLLRPGGVLSYFEYALVRRLKMPFVGRGERGRLRDVGRVVGRYIAAHQVRRELVLANVPPAVVRRLVLKDGAAGG
jgi:phosphatidylethanolamine/phosphatidyl-N-methylethanolamine N-methyltransferase